MRISQRSVGAHHMILGGVPIRTALVRQLAALLDEDEPLARKLGSALEGTSPIVALTVQERVALVGVLGADPPAGLRPLRDTLLNEFRQRKTHAHRATGDDRPDAAEIHDA